MQFIPERFDPESKYFFTPGNESKQRGSLSKISFSCYLRVCPGQTLAMLETKVLVAYLFMNFKFNFDKELIESPYAFFRINSQFEMNFTLDE